MTSSTVLRALLGLTVCATAASAQATYPYADKYLLPGGSSFDSFGRAIAVAPGRLVITGNGLDNRGAAVAYRRQGGAWVAYQSFTGSDTVAGDFFGFSAAVDGTTLVVGANQAETPAFNAGAAYVFERMGETWTQVQKLTPPVSTASDKFGNAVAVSGDVIVVGCAGDDEAGIEAGAAYVYREVGGTWLFEQKLLASTADDGDQFGWQVDTDGSSIIASALEDEIPAGAAGAVFEFQFDGSEWNEVQRVTDPAGAAGDRFGWDLDLEVGRLFVGAPEKDGRGAVVVFDGGPGAWSFQDSVTPVKVAAGDSFGWSLDASGDRFVAGAPGTTGVPTAAFAGALYQVQFDGTRWVGVQQGLNGEPSAGFPFPQMGMECALLGNSAFAGAPFGLGVIANTGSVYRYDVTELGLDVVPDEVPFEGEMAVRTSGGLTANPMAVFILEISGTPVLLQAYGGVFDANGEHLLSVTVPASVSGLDITILAAGYRQPGLLGYSDLVEASFL